jgi:hypothetical protein
LGVCALGVEQLLSDEGCERFGEDGRDKLLLIISNCLSVSLQIFFLYVGPESANNVKIFCDDGESLAGDAG